MDGNEDRLQIRVKKNLEQKNDSVGQGKVRARKMCRGPYVGGEVKRQHVSGGGVRQA